MSMNRRQMLAVSIRLGGWSLPSFLALRAATAKPSGAGRAKACIIVYCWGGMSHIDTWDPKPDSPREVRGEFGVTATVTPGIFLSEHLPQVAQHTDKLAIVRSIYHDDSAHGRGMYWNLTGHRPPGVGNIPPARTDWPSLPAVVSKLWRTPRGVPPAVRLPYPLVDNNTLQAGEYGGWLGAKYDPVVIRTPRGEPFGGVSRTLGAEALHLGDVDTMRLALRSELRQKLERRMAQDSDFDSFHHFRTLASDILLSDAVRRAYDLDREDEKLRQRYGEHIGGQSMLLARRLVEAGVPVVQVCCAAGDLNGSVGDHWDTHSDNFRRLKDRLLPVFDRGFSALLEDLQQRGMLDETLVVMLTDFGRTPRVNGAVGRDHYPDVYSVVLAGGGIRGGQVYGSSDRVGAHPHSQPCGPADIHATIFSCLGIDPRTEIHDPLGRPLPVSDGQVLPLC
jgi:hypothetical protein